MSKKSKAEALGHAAAALLAAPHDLGAWLKLASALETAGDDKAASEAFEKLGAAASDLGQVALAAACARRLEVAGQKERAERLVKAIADAHARGSSRIDRSLRARPPAPPPVEPSGGAEIEPATDRKRALEQAKEAIEAASARARERAPAKLPPTPLVGVLEPSEVRELFSVMQLADRREGDVIIEVGEPAQALYWIARGGAVATRDDHELGELRANAFFGEIALVGGTTRTARVTCTSDTWLIEVPADALEKVAARAPKLGKVLAGYARSRLLANVMRTSEIFSRISEEERRELLPMFETALFSAGSRIVEKGSEGDRLYVVVSGHCEVRDDGEVLSTLSVGDGVGEISLLARKPAVADVVAVEQTVMLCLPREKFDAVAVKHPGLLAEVYKLLVEREQANRDAIIHDADDLII